MHQPPVWTITQLEDERLKAEEHFREGRNTEPLELYLQLFDQYQTVVEEVMEETVDLTKIDTHALAILANEQKREVFRYLFGPPVSEDDMKTLMEARSLSAKHLGGNPVLLAKMLQFLKDWHDRRRFPWLSADYTPTEPEQKAAILATTALLAMRRVETSRRKAGSSVQEELVEVHLVNAGYKKVPKRTIKTLGSAPQKGEFCRESKLAGRKADIVIGLWDGRTFALECKVSNSSTNSVKRLNNDAAVKAETWRERLGTTQVVCGAMLGGVYGLNNLEDAQNRGLSIFWSHDLKQLTDFIESTR